ncbi:hypothetical protein, partial [Mesorhizobium sp. M1403]|uniref:hypothetical protein n=1 Tax=Mesorhizobium sp. M1403 TaxID=2957097 RepID=UPI00333A413E
SCGASLSPATLEIGESQCNGQSPHSWGRCPAGQRGARQNATLQLSVNTDLGFYRSQRILFLLCAGSY